MLNFLMPILCLLFWSAALHGIQEMQLSNGMKVILKRVENEEEDIEIRLIARGGWAGLNKEEKTNARIASDVLWESGFGNLSSDQIHALMWLSSVELESAIGPFSRTIDGSTSPEGVETLFQLIHGMFTSPQFTQAGMQETIKRISLKLQLQPFDSFQTFDSLSKALNTAYYKGFRQLSIRSLKTRAEIELLKKVYAKCFGNPQEFRVFISGYFDEERMHSYVKKYLESIPLIENHTLTMTTKENGFPYFPEGIVRLEIPSSQIYNESLIRITFPITKKIDKNNLKKLFLISELINKRFDEESKRKWGLKEKNFICSFNFPFYPYLVETWVYIQFHSKVLEEVKDPLEVEKLAIMILHDLIHKGPTKLEMAYLQELSKNRKTQEESDLLKFFFPSDENLKSLKEDETLDKKDPITQRDYAQMVSELIDLHHYTIIFSKPQSLK